MLVMISLTPVVCGEGVVEVSDVENGELDVFNASLA